MPIWHFLQEQLLNYKGGKEIPRRMWLLAKAVKEQDNDEDKNGEKEDPEAEGAGWPYSTILHTAYAVGNYWLIRLQIEAGVDVSALDEHSWTALMVATAQGHASCANLLSKHMETGNVKAAPQPLSPSSLYQIDSKTELIDGQENLTAVADSSILRRMCDYFSSDHPIPLHLQTFYYEIKNLSEGRHILYVHINAIDLVHTNSSFPVWASMDQWKVLVRQARRQFFGLTVKTGSNGT